MTRERFLLVAAVVPGAFGAVMMLAPRLMLDNSLAVAVTTGTVEVTRWVGFAVFSLAWVTFLSRHDAGSPALVAVMSGNVVFHVLGTVMDVQGFATDTLTTSGLVTGVVPHLLLAGGFVFFLVGMRHPTPIRQRSGGSSQRAEL